MPYIMIEFGQQVLTNVLSFKSVDLLQYLPFCNHYYQYYY